MVEDAKRFEKDDAARLEVLEARADLENLIFSASAVATSGKGGPALQEALSETKTWFEMVEASSMTLRDVNTYRRKLQRFITVA